MRNMNKVIVILGQTATGKSDFAVSVAQYLKSQGVISEIISADSRQVYKGMDLGTGKITKKEMQGVTHHMLDVVSPKKIFSVSDFQKQSDKKIKKMIQEKKIPIICGGTGFYIDSVVDGTILPEVKPNKPLRLILEKKSTEALSKILSKLDPSRSEDVDQKNRVRLIRAIEIAKALGSVPKIVKSNNYEALKIGLVLPDEILKDKIKTRLISRIKKGMLREIKRLHEEGVSWKRMEALGLEYRYGSLYLQGKISKEGMVEKLNTEIWHYAKRQRTWFKKDKDTIWIDPRSLSDQARAIKKVKDFLK
jgi:tRNA dimethylallyltransferase